MKKTLNLPIYVMVFSFILALSFGCKNESSTTSTASTEPATEKVDKSTEESSTPPADTSENVVETDTSSQEPPADVTTDTQTSPPSGNGGGGINDNRAVDDERIAVVLDNIAVAMEAEKLEYKSELGQDCSGIYHKLKDSIQKKISAFGDRSKYHYPTFSEDRNSRQIAHWYHKNNNLMIVQDPLKDCNKIRPGSVMFYGRTEEKYNNSDINLLSNPDVFQHDGTKGKIMHIAVVTKVEKDDAGNVVRYTIMHGRNSRHTASRTSGNYDGPGSYKTQFAKFPFGNWNQQWVAMAYIETPIN